MVIEKVCHPPDEVSTFTTTDSLLSDNWTGPHLDKIWLCRLKIICNPSLRPIPATSSISFKGTVLSLFIRCTTLGLILCFCATQGFAGEVDNPEATVSTPLLQTDHSWDGAAYKSYPAGQPQLTVLRIVVPAHTALPWHTHPMPNAAYVLSGSLHVESKDGLHKKSLHAGEVLSEMVGTVHRGWTEESPVELIVFYAGVKGMPTAAHVDQ
ncbi:cupin domain-containing protein [Paraburkholderia sediminicola]|uniref:cupin domain-containing protein n=1 Tax=Paraburkholderia sediminicola TaxID=458836 RepID=UPI0038BB5CE5